MLTKFNEDYKNTLKTTQQKIPTKLQINILESRKEHQIKGNTLAKPYKLTINTSCVANKNNISCVKA